jgi:hypothetical protein
VLLSGEKSHLNSKTNKKKRKNKKKRESVTETETKGKETKILGTVGGVRVCEC